ncbi:MAG: PhoH family protein [Defluviitaleaceae bacterium]|nr:PhoH family protein [Defluviitaleaceae bacterium]
MNHNQTARIFGNNDENIRKIEDAFGVTVVNRGEEIVVVGEGAKKRAAEEVLRKLLAMANSGDEINEQMVNYVIDSREDGTIGQIENLPSDHICMTYSGKMIKSKTLGQKKYVEQIRKNTVTFGIGPAGTGKTYIAMAMAINAFKKGDVSRIIMTRPAIEAGERLGFLPGDLQQKVDPYLRPLYDALFEIMGAEAYHKQLERGNIEVAPLAYMRGRTLDNSFIVLDEAQNTTPEQMKMFLTRIGFGSKAVITGDITQIDLPADKKSGLKHAAEILTDVEGLGMSWLTNKDVVRHPLVQRIIKAYEKHEAKTDHKKRRVLLKARQRG